MSDREVERSPGKSGKIQRSLEKSRDVWKSQKTTEMFLTVIEKEKVPPFCLSFQVFAF
jgi:hypothetical protein